LIKNFTGNDAITARFLHQSEFTFYPKFKLICNTNYLPLVTDTTVFKSDRVQVIPFTKHFEESEQDKQLKNKLSSNESLSGILDWCIRGWLLFNQEGLTEPETIRTSTVEYAQSSDKLENFIGDCLSKKQGHNLAIKDVYAKYEEWCSDNGYHTENKGNFIADIKSKNIYRVSGTVNGKTTRNIIAGYDFADDETEDFVLVDDTNETLPFN
jgi:P4 family phage/plasmid primase-like protien